MLYNTFLGGNVMPISKKVMNEGTGENVGGERGQMAVFKTTMSERAVNRVGTMEMVPNTASQEANARMSSKEGEGNERLVEG